MSSKHGNAALKNNDDDDDDIENERRL